MERNIYFICLCGKHLVANEAGAGQEVNCPDCGKPLIIPNPAMEWACSCGAPILIPANLAMFGESVYCVECNATHKLSDIEDPADAPDPEPVPLAEPRMPISTPPQQTSPISFDRSMICPSCGAPIRHDYISCANCGLHLRTGRKLKPARDVHAAADCNLKPILIAAFIIVACGILITAWLVIRKWL